MIRLSARPRQSDWLNPVQWDRARQQRPTLLPMITAPSPRKLRWDWAGMLLGSFVFWFALIVWALS